MGLLLVLNGYPDVLVTPYHAHFSSFSGSDTRFIIDYVLDQLFLTTMKGFKKNRYPLQPWLCRLDATVIMLCNQMDNNNYMMQTILLFAI